MGILFFIMSPQENEKDVFFENGTMGVEDLTGYNLNLEEYIGKSKSMIEGGIEKVKFISSKKLSANDKEYWLLEYTGYTSNLDLYFYQAVWLKNEIAYLITLTAPKKGYKKYQKIFSKIAASFIVK